MVLKLYGYPQAASVLRVGVVLHEKKVPFEFYLIDMAKGEHKDPEYKKNNPFGQVPYLDDDGFILFESRAICRYIQEKYPHQGSSLVPTDFKSRMMFEQAASIEAFNFEFLASRGAAEIYKPWFGLGETDMVVFNSLMNRLDEKIQVYDKILSKQKYLTGDNITMADLFHLPFGAFLKKNSPTDVLTKHPNFDRWLKELENRPSWLTVKDGVSSVSSYEVTN